MTLNKSVRGRISMTMVLTGLLLSFLLWAAFFSIDESVRAQGQIITTSRTQIIQAVDGGVLSRLSVHEGDHVKEGQLLATLDPERFEASYRETLGRVIAQEAALVRLQAEVDDKALIFGPRFSDFPEIVAAQRGLYMQRKRSLDEQLAVQMEGLRLAQEELTAKEKLYGNGDVSQMDVLRSRMQISDIKGRMAETKNRYLQDARLERTRVQEELSSQKEKLVERQAVFAKTELRAPLNGIVKLLRVTTIGGVLRPGDEIMQIAPEESDWVLEVKVPPSEIGRLKVGLSASVKLDAFDFSIYGSSKGRVIYISPDTLVEQGPNGSPLTYYRTHIRIEDEQKRRQDVNLQLGMSGTADVLVGSRTVLSYIAKPIVKTLGTAMTER